MEIVEGSHIEGNGYSKYRIRKWVAEGAGSAIIDDLPNYALVVGAPRQTGSFPRANSQLLFELTVTFGVSA